MKPWRRPAFWSRQGRDGVSDFLFSQSDERTPEEGAQSQCVAPIGNGAGQGDQILDFLTTEKTFAGL